MKKFVLLAFVLLMVLSFAGTIIMVTDTGGLGDKSFNDLSWAGTQRFAKDFHWQYKVIQSHEQADYVPNLSSAAQQADVVVATGFMFGDALAKVAPKFPKTWFIFVDGFVKAPNVICMNFKEQEGAFLAGYLAAAMTQSGEVGFVGGIPIPPVERYRYGYEAGVETYNELNGTGVTVIKGYTQSFNDASKGKQLTLSQFSQGADIVFAAAGLCGLGTIQAAKEQSIEAWKKYYNKTVSPDVQAPERPPYMAIGVDSDQDYIAKGYVLASAMKKVDVAVYLAAKSVAEGKPVAGLHKLGLKEDAVGLSPMKYTLNFVKDYVPELPDQLKTIENWMRTGKLVVPDTQQKLDSFQLPADLHF